MPRSRLAACVLALGTLLTGCGSDAPDAPVAQPSAADDTPPSPSPSPAAVLDPRSPEALGAELDFDSVPTTTPAQARAVEGYESFIRSFAIAQALPDASYPPLLASMGAELSATVVGQLEGLVQEQRYIDGPYVERVLEVGTGPETIAMRVCSDISGRQVRDRATGDVRPGGQVPNSILLVTMTATREGYDVSSIAVPPTDASC